MRNGRAMVILYRNINDHVNKIDLTPLPEKVNDHPGDFLFLSLFK